MPLSTFQIILGLNDPSGGSFMDSTAGPTYLVTELQDIKSAIRTLDLGLPWISLLGLEGGSSWSGALVWTFIDGTHASIQGNQTPTGTDYIQVPFRAKAFVTAGTIYGQVTAAVFASSITTVTFVWDNAGALDAGLTDIQFGGDTRALSPRAQSQSHAVVFSQITNGGSGPAFTGVLVPSIGAYTEGLEYVVQWQNVNAGNDTIDLGPGPLPVVRYPGAPNPHPLEAGDIDAGEFTSLYYDDTGPQFQISTLIPNIPRIKNIQTGGPLSVISNTAVETTLYSFTLPGGKFTLNSTLRFRLEGRYLNNSGAPRDVTLKFYLGGVPFVETIMPAMPVSAFPVTWGTEIKISTLGSLSQEWISMFTFFGTVGVAVGANDVGAIAVSRNGGALVDTATPQAITLTGQMSSATATQALDLWMTDAVMYGIGL